MQAVSKKIDKMDHKMYYLFDICGNDMNGKEIKYFGYKLAKEEINIYVCIGSLRLIQDDLMGKIDKNLVQTKKTGKTQICFHNKNSDGKELVWQLFATIGLNTFRIYSNQGTFNVSRREKTDNNGTLSLVTL